MQRAIPLALALTLFVLTKVAYAQVTNTTDSKGLAKQLQMLQEELLRLKAVVSEQQEQINELKQLPKAPQSSANVASDNTVATKVEPTSTGGKGGFPAIPEIGVVGDIVGTKSDTLSDDEGNNRISVRELELVLGSDIDPYSRFDSTITFSDFEDPDVEEAYVSYWGLPGEVKGRIGRMHQLIGKASATHRDALETVDEP